MAWKVTRANGRELKRFDSRIVAQSWARGYGDATGRKIRVVHTRRSR